MSDKRFNYLYAIYDVEMAMWTAPVMLRNDLEAQRYFTRMLKEDVFNGCTVEFYRLGSYQIDSKVSVNPFTFLGVCNPERIFVEDSVSNGEADTPVDAI